MRHQQPRNGKCGFFKFLEMSSQLLAIFVQLLQRFVAIDKITERGNPKLHVLIVLMGQPLIIILKYLAGIILPVEEILHVDFSCHELLNSGLKLCKQLRRRCQTTTWYFQ
jgi:hypothetical protein